MTREAAVAKDLIDRIDEMVERRSLLKHPFYQAWSMGTLPLDSLKEYASEYYHYELAYPTFLSGLHHRCTDQGVRQHLLDNLWDEEHGEDNHVELWLRFCDALDLDRDTVRTGTPTAATASLVDTYRDLTSHGPLAAGAAALYAYESQVPQVADSKIEGLDRFYGMDGDRDTSFFRVHRTLDVEHSAAERDMVRGLADDDDTEEAVIDAVDRATDSLWRFLDGVYA
jgi:pyrroloquinoline-quinone synthase